MLAMAVVNHEKSGNESKSVKEEDDILSTLNRLRQTLQECHGRVGAMNQRMDSLLPKFAKKIAVSIDYNCQRDKCGKYIGKVHHESNIVNIEMQNHSSTNGNLKMNGIMNGNHEEVIKDLKGSSPDGKQALPRQTNPNKENYHIRDLVQSSLSSYIPDLHNINDPQDLLLLAEKHANEICKMYQSQSNEMKKGHSLPASEEKPVLNSNDSSKKDMHIHTKNKSQYNGHHSIEAPLEEKHHDSQFSGKNSDAPHISNGLQIPEKRKLRAFVKRKEWWAEKHKEIAETSKNLKDKTSFGVGEYHDWDSGYLEYEEPELYNEELNGRTYIRNDLGDFKETEFHDESGNRPAFIGDLKITKTMEPSQFFPRDTNFTSDELIKEMINGECESDLMFQDDVLRTTLTIDHTKREVPHRKRRRHILERMRSIDLEDLPEENENLDTLQPSLEEKCGPNSENTESAVTKAIDEKTPQHEEVWKETELQDTKESISIPYTDDNENVFINIFTKQIEESDIYNFNGEAKQTADNDTYNFNGEMEITEESLDFMDNLPQHPVKTKEMQCERLCMPTETEQIKRESSSHDICTSKNLLDSKNNNVCDSNTAVHTASVNTISVRHLCDSKIPKDDDKAKWKTNKSNSTSLQKTYKLSSDSHKEYKAKKMRRRYHVMERLRNITYSEKVLLLTDKHAYSGRKVSSDMGSLLYMFISVVFLVLLLFIFYLLVTAPLVTVSFKQNGGPVAF